MNDTNDKFDNAVGNVILLCVRHIYFSRIIVLAEPCLIIDHYLNEIIYISEIIYMYISSLPVSIFVCTFVLRCNTNNYCNKNNIQLLLIMQVH